LKSTLASSIKLTACILSYPSFGEIDLNPKAVDNIEMGYIFEELVRRFNEAATRKLAITLPLGKLSD